MISIPWYYAAVIGFVAAALGFLVAALCAMARCNECETIQRIARGGK